MSAEAAAETDQVNKRNLFLPAAKAFVHADSLKNEKLEEVPQRSLASFSRKWTELDFKTQEDEVRRQTTKA